MKSAFLQEFISNQSLHLAYELERAFNAALEWELKEF